MAERPMAADREGSALAAAAVVAWFLLAWAIFAAALVAELDKVFR